MNYKIPFYSLLTLGVLGGIVFGPRIIKGLKLKKDKKNTYAIQNVQTGRCIRPYNAGFEEENRVILYDLKNWECITWQFIELKKDTYLLKNLYTQKTFEPVSEPEEGVSLWQKILGGSKWQYWEFIEQSEGVYHIRLKGTELYLTPETNELNANIILKPSEDTTAQKWTLVEQHPIV